MSCYKRIYYVDYCENGKRQVNAGFVKLVQWKERDETSFQLYLSNVAPAEAAKCPVKILCGGREVVLGQVMMDSGKGMARIEDLEMALVALEEDGNFDKSVLRVVVDENRYYECVIKEGTDLREKSMTIEAAEVPAPQEESEPALPILEAPADLVPGIRQVKSDKWQQLGTVMPHIHPFEDDREYLQVELKDMVVLAGLFYRLVENSFLLHGYYNYGHLILTKIHKKGKEKIYIGVPGNYYAKEAQIAVMFGFESFESKEEPAREGDFGYYMIGVDI